MRYWDSSAIFSLLVEEDFSAKVLELYKNDSEIITWWATDIECMSALARLERRSEIYKDNTAAALHRLSELRKKWQTVHPSDAVRSTAYRLLRAHDLRAADAMQLAAALVVCDGQPSDLHFVTLDSRLSVAAFKESFVIQPSDRMS